MKYQEYLKSERWNTLSELAKIFADKKCQLCNSTERIETHHRSYENIESEVEFFDLIVLCHECHEKYHDELPKENINTVEILEENKRQWIKYLPGADEEVRNTVCLLLGYADEKNIEEVNRLQEYLATLIR